MVFATAAVQASEPHNRARERRTPSNGSSSTTHPRAFAWVALSLQVLALWLLLEFARPDTNHTTINHSHPAPHRQASLSGGDPIDQLVSRFQERDLARIFITNAGPLAQDLKHDLAETGVLHHLAISAGQLAPVLLVVGSLLARVSAGPGRSYLRGNIVARVVAFGLVTWALCAMYGMTGSLMRLLLLSSVRQIFVMILLTGTLQASFGCRPLAKAALRLFTRHEGPFMLASLIVLSAQGHNLIWNWSFLFACIGASACAMGIVAYHFCSRVAPLQRPAIRMVVSFLFMQACAATAMSPLTQTGFLASMLANLVCTPLVALAIVPSTVVLTLMARGGFDLQGFFKPIYNGFIAIADTGLAAFRQVVEGIAARMTDPQPPVFAPFSNEAHSYVVLWIALCWLVPQIFQAVRGCQHHEMSVRLSQASRQAQPRI